MNELIKLLSEYSASNVISLFIIFLLIILGSVDLFKKIKGLFDSYHNKLSTQENKESSIDDRITYLENSQEESKRQIGQIQSDITNIKDNIDTLQENQNRSNRATCRSAMYRLANELINKKWMSEDEYDTLNDLTEVYLMSTSKDKTSTTPHLIQRALSLPVLTAEEITNLNTKENNDK